MGYEGGAYESKQYPLGLSVSIIGLLLSGRFLFVCSANQLAQHLALNIGVLVDKARERIGIHGQPIAPLLDCVKKVAGSSRLAVEVSQLFFNRLDVDAAHEFANVLHLPSATFNTVDPDMHIDSLTQGVSSCRRARVSGFNWVSFRPIFCRRSASRLSADLGAHQAGVITYALDFIEHQQELTP